MQDEVLGIDFPISRYLQEKSSARGIPISGQFELTSRCNFNCKMCYVHDQKNSEKLKKRELSADQWISIAEDAKKAGMLFLLLTGGEAMLRDDFVRLYQNLATMGFRIVVNSNGSMLTDEVISCFKRYPPARVNISLYGASDQTYQSLCGNRAYDKVRKAIHTLKEIGISVRITMMLTKYNAQDMEKVYQVVREEDTGCEMSAYMFPPIRLENGVCGCNDARFSPEEAGAYMVKKNRMMLGDEEFYRQTETIRDSKPSPDMPEEYFTTGEPIRCQAGRGSFWLTWDGRMLPCGMMMDDGVSVLKHGFDEAWRLTREATEKIRLPVECVTCKDKNLCKACASVCQAESGDFHRKPEYSCRMARAMRKEYARHRAEIEKQMAVNACSQAGEGAREDGK